jgi:hypothetical protein
MSDTIENYVEALHHIGRHEDLLSNGEYKRVRLETDTLRHEQEPRLFRAAIWRKGHTSNVIKRAEEVGLKVADVWQYNDDKEKDEIRLKLVKDD